MDYEKNFLLQKISLLENEVTFLKEELNFFNQIKLTKCQEKKISTMRKENQNPFKQRFELELGKLNKLREKKDLPVLSKNDFAELLFADREKMTEKSRHTKLAALLGGGYTTMPVNFLQKMCSIFNEDRNRGLVKWEDFF